MSTHDVTVVIPAFNEAATLRLCLHAAGLKSDTTRARIVVADNGSDDDTARIALECGADVVLASRRGAGAARNAGIAAADTDYIAFLDGDCVARKGWLDALMGAMDRPDRSDVAVGGETRWLHRDPRTRAFYNRYNKTNARTSKEQPPVLQTSNAVFRRDALEGVNGFCSAVRWCEDVDLCIRIAARGGTFGYEKAAVVDSWAPDTGWDQLRQYYTYGVGIEEVRARHPTVVVDRSRPGGWRALVRDAAAGPSSQRAHGARKLLMEMAYSVGRTEGRRRVAAAHRRQGGERLRTVHLRLPPVGNERRACITIEGAPGPATPTLLRILHTHRARASFFVTGEKAAGEARLVAALRRQGHDVHSSSWSGERFDTLSADDITAQLRRTSKALGDAATGPVQGPVQVPVQRRGPRYVRLPFGAGVEDPQVHGAIERWNPSGEIVQWSLDVEAWRFAQRCITGGDVARQSGAAADRALLSPGLGGAIINLHDADFRGGGLFHAECVAATLDRILRGLEERGIEAVTVSEAIPGGRRDRRSDVNLEQDPLDQAVQSR